MHTTVEMNGLSKQRRMRLLNWAAGILLGGVLLLAAAGKMLDPILFVEQIRNEGLNLLWGANQVALLALALETGLGVALVTGVRNRWILALSGLLVVFFVFLTGRNYWLVLQGLRDETSSCGCFGTLVQRTPAQAFWQDLLLLVPPFWILLWTRGAIPQEKPRRRLGVAGLAVISVLLYTILGPGLPPGEVAVASNPGARAQGEFLAAPGYVLVQNGEPISGAEIHESARDLQFLLSSAELKFYLLLDLKKGVVFQLAPEGVVRFTDGSKSLAAEGESREVGPFQVALDGVRFSLGSTEFLLGRNPQVDEASR